MTTMRVNPGAKPPVMFAAPGSHPKPERPPSPLAVLARLLHPGHTLTIGPCEREAEAG